MTTKEKARIGENTGSQKGKKSVGNFTSIYIKQNYICSEDLKNFLYVELDTTKACLKKGGNVPGSIHQKKYEELTGNQNGILTGYNNLVVFDIDDEGIYEYIKDSLPETLVVKTGSNKIYKKHYYYYLPDRPSTFSIQSQENKTLIDILGYRDNGNYSMAVAAGTFNTETGYQYIIENDVSVRKLTGKEYKEILDIIYSYPEIKSSPSKGESSGQSKKVFKGYQYSNIFSLVKEEMDLKDYLLKCGYNIKSNKIICPWHNDKKKSMQINKDYAYCYGCNKTASIVDFIMLHNSLETKDFEAFIKANYPSIYEKYKFKDVKEKEQMKSDESKDKKHKKFNISEHTKKLKDVHEKEIEPINFVVDGIIPEGITLVSAPAKVGKTSMLMDISLDIARGQKAFGDFETMKTDVLLCLFEDNERTAQFKSNKLINHCPEGIDILFQDVPFPKENDAVEAVRNYVEENPNTKMIVLDTIHTIKPNFGKGNTTQQDYDFFTPGRKLAQDKRLFIVIVQHNNKRIDVNDPFESVSGTTGSVASVENVMVIGHNSMKPTKRTMYIRGNYTEEKKYEFYVDNMKGFYQGETQICQLNTGEQRIYDAMEYDVEYTTQTIEEISGQGKNTTRDLNRLENKGIVEKVSRGIGKKIIQ